jgi:hypothetical protein
MRYYNKRKDLKLFAFSGSHTVLLSFDIDKKKLKNKNFLGFCVERKDKDGNVALINGRKPPVSLINDTTPFPKIKSSSLVRSFFCKDNFVYPGETYTYTIKAMGPKSFKSLYENSIRVKTEKIQRIAYRNPKKDFSRMETKINPFSYSKIPAEAAWKELDSGAYVFYSPPLPF